MDQRNGVQCNVGLKHDLIIDESCLISELETGAQLCAGGPWGEFKYPTLVQDGNPVRVETEVSVQFEARK
jgi:hypothetical protein